MSSTMPNQESNHTTIDIFTLLHIYILIEVYALNDNSY